MNKGHTSPCLEWGQISEGISGSLTIFNCNSDSDEGSSCRIQTPPIKANSFRTYHVTAIADTGAQTCSCGPEAQKALGYPDEYMILTTHQIWGITEDPLDIREVMFACIRAGSKETRQAIYMFENTSGFYLSESALKK